MYQGPSYNGKFSSENLSSEMSAITNKCKLLGLGPKQAYKLAIIYDDFNVNVFEFANINGVYQFGNRKIIGSVKASTTYVYFSND